MGVSVILTLVTLLWALEFGSPAPSQSNPVSIIQRIGTTYKYMRTHRLGNTKITSYVPLHLHCFSKLHSILSFCLMSSDANGHINYYIIGDNDRLHDSASSFKLKPPSRRTCLIIISKLFFTAVPIPSFDTCVFVCVCVCVSVVSVIVKCPVLPPCAVDGHSRNPLYCYY